jgi:hypothetical protein
MSKVVGPIASPTAWCAYSVLPAAQQQACLEECRELADAVHEGLDLSLEIRATAEHRFGETAIIFRLCSGCQWNRLPKEVLDYARRFWDAPNSSFARGLNQWAFDSIRV